MADKSFSMHAQICMRWWAVPLLYASALLFAIGLERVSEGVDGLVHQHGWKIRTDLRPRRLDRHTGVWTVDRAGQVRTNGAGA